MCEYVSMCTCVHACCVCTCMCGCALVFVWGGGCRGVCSTYVHVCVCAGPNLRLGCDFSQGQSAGASVP